VHHIITSATPPTRRRLGVVQTFIVYFIRVYTPQFKHGRDGGRGTPCNARFAALWPA
jgi:hypothetical protein